MIKERLECELAEKYGEFIIRKTEKVEGITDLQYAFERLGCLLAFSQLGADLTIDSERKCWKTIEDAFEIPRATARLLLQIAYQCPKEFRIAHLSQASQTHYISCLDKLKGDGIIIAGKDFYGEYYSLAPRFMRVLAYGQKWTNPKKRFNPSSMNPFDNFNDNYDEQI